MEPQTIQFVGAPCGHHGPYTFYKAFKFATNRKYRILTLGEFFFVKISENAPVAIGELQLLWEDKNNESVYMTSVRLYFLPEHTPEGRQEYHGEDEILAESDKIVLRLEDLCRWIIDNIEWPIGSRAVCDDDIKAEPEHADLTKLFAANNSGLKFKDIKKEKEMMKDSAAWQPSSVTILSYSRYCRYRAIMKRLEHVSNSWLKNALVSAIGGFTAPTAGTRVVFCRDTFEHPDLVTHDYRQDHLAPNLKGRPRKKKQKQKKDMESDSNDSDFTPGKEDRGALVKPKETNDHKIRRKVLRPNKDKVTEDEQKFISNLMSFMKRRKTPIDRIPSLGFKQIDLYYFYNYAQKLGGYDQITQRRMWKHLYDKLGGNPGSTSAATCTRRHYERLLLAFERYQRGEKDLTPPPESPQPARERRDSNDFIEEISAKDFIEKDKIKNNHVSSRMLMDSVQSSKIAAAAVVVVDKQKAVLAEQSPNHLSAHPAESAPHAKRPDSKENGLLLPPPPRAEPEEVAAAAAAAAAAAGAAAPPTAAGGGGSVRPLASMGGLQREPNMVMVVSKNGEMVRANRSGPSIMTPMMKRPGGAGGAGGAGSKGPPPPLLLGGVIPITTANAAVFHLPPGKTGPYQGLTTAHQNNRQTRTTTPQHYHNRLESTQQSQEQQPHEQYHQHHHPHHHHPQQQQQQQQQRAHHHQHHNHHHHHHHHHHPHQPPHPLHNSIKQASPPVGVLPKGSLRAPSIVPNGTVRYLVDTAQLPPRLPAAAHSAPPGRGVVGEGGLGDPRRPTVIQHTQPKADPSTTTPPPAYHTQPAAYPGAQARASPSSAAAAASSSSSPVPLSAGLKRSYPFTVTPSQTADHPTAPPSAHAARQSPTMYFRDLDPYVPGVGGKRLHLTNINSISGLTPPALAHSHPAMLQPPSRPVGSGGGGGSGGDDEPTDLSLKRRPTPDYAAANHTGGEEVGMTSGQSTMTGRAPPAEEGPLNLVTHKRSQDTGSGNSSSSSSTANNGVVNHAMNFRPISQSPRPLGLVEPPSKVPRDLSVPSPRTLPEAALYPPLAGRPPSLPSPRISPRPPSRSSPKMSPRPPSTHATLMTSAVVVTSASIERPWSSAPQGARPVTVSPEFGAAIHPAFPQLTANMLPGLLPPTVRPQVFYEAQLRATQSLATSGATTQDALTPGPTQLLLAPTLAGVTTSASAAAAAAATPAAAATTTHAESRK